MQTENVRMKQQKTLRTSWKATYNSFCIMTEATDMHYWESFVFRMYQYNYSSVIYFSIIIFTLTDY